MRTRKLEVDRDGPAAGRGRGLRGDAPGPGPRGHAQDAGGGGEGRLPLALPHVRGPGQRENGVRHGAPLPGDPGGDPGEGRPRRHAPVHRRPQEPPRGAHVLAGARGVRPPGDARREGLAHRTAGPAQLHGNRVPGPRGTGRTADPGARRRFREGPEDRPRPRVPPRRPAARHALLRAVRQGRRAVHGARHPPSARLRPGPVGDGERPLVHGRGARPKGVEVVFAGRSNTPAGRIRAGEEAAGRFRVAGGARPWSVRVRGGRERTSRRGAGDAGQLLRQRRGAAAGF